MTAVLVIGAGSIGVRHARAAAALGCEVAMVTRRADVDGARFRSVEDVAGFAPDVVVIANETGKHRETLAAVGRTWPASRVLVEKPLFARAEPLPDVAPAATYVGYCLRFHPAVQAVVEQVGGRRLFSVHATVGQHLSQWRPGTDYRASYSARAGEGGALRDLSHELDLVQLVGGAWQQVAALVGHVSDLETTAEDAASLLMQTERCAHVTVHVDVIDRAPRRSLVVHAEGTTAEADLIAGVVRIDGAAREAAPAGRDAMLEAQLRAVIGGEERWLCSAREAYGTMGLIAAAESAAAERRWVGR